MRNQLFAAVLAIFAGLSPLWGANQAAGASGKVGVINIQAAILSTAEWKQAFAELQAKYKPRKDAITQAQQAVNDLQDQIQKQADTLTDSEAARLEHELQDKQTNLKQMTDEANSDFTYDRNTAMRRIGTKMLKVINKYAKDNGLSLVLDVANVPVYYAATGIDITAPVVKLYDSSYPAASAAKPGAAAGADAGTKPKS